MGQHGPVPKRSEQRRRRNTNEAGPPQKIRLDPVTVPVPALREGIHPLAAAWYGALAESGQSRFYEPSDWMMAQLLCEAIEAFAETRRAGLLDTILSGAASLLVTEGDRRRMRLELERPDAEDTDADAADATVTDLRSRFGG